MTPWLSLLSLPPILVAGALAHSLFIVALLSRHLAPTRVVSRVTVLNLLFLAYVVTEAAVASAEAPETARFLTLLQRLCLVAAPVVLAELLRVGLGVLNAGALSLFALGPIALGIALPFSSEATAAAGRTSVLGIWRRWDFGFSSETATLYALLAGTALLFSILLARTAAEVPFRRRIVAAGLACFAATAALDAVTLALGWPLPLFLDGGIILLSIAFQTDLGRSLIHEHQRVVHYNALRSRIMDNLSHELRTPMGVVRGYLEMLRTGVFGPLAEAQLGAVAVAEENALVETDLIDDLLLAATLEKRMVEPDWNEVELGEVMTAVVAEVGRRYRDTKTETAIRTEGRVFAFGDRALLRKLFQKIVGNAYKYGSHGSRIDIDIARIEDSVRVIVEDRGPGIAEPLIERIVEPFAQTQAEGTDAYSGVGLGLGIAHEIIDLHRGTLAIENRQGGGLRVEIRLPK